MAQQLTEVGAEIAAILLAAGESTRMVETKALLDWYGMPLVRYQIEQLSAAGVSEVVVVLGHRADELQRAIDEMDALPRVHTAVNSDYRQGKTTSIKTGLRNLRGAAKGVIHLAADQPRPAAVLQRLVDEHLKGGNLISIPSHGGKHGHPPLFDASLIPELLEITEAKMGVREVIERHRDAVRGVSMESAVVLTNLNTREDYEAAKQAFG